jgi:hypothetical protein
MRGSSSAVLPNRSARKLRICNIYSDRSLLSWLKDIAGDDMIQTSSHVQSRINLNILDSRKLVYRWHFDAVCYTAILYLTDVRPQDGGSLRVIPKCCQHVAPDLRTAKFCDIWPSAGPIVLMDGTRCYHRVTSDTSYSRVKIRFVTCGKVRSGPGHRRRSLLRSFRTSF